MNAGEWFLAVLIVAVIVMAIVRPCDIRHRWGKWETYTVTDTTKHFLDCKHLGDDTKTRWWQKRTCTRCDRDQHLRIT